MNKAILNYFIITILMFVLLFGPNSVEAINCREVKGFIESVMPEKNMVRINNEFFKIADDCKIKRNGITVKLISCGPINEGVYQWAEADVSDHKIINLKVNYKVVEGIIKEVGMDQEYIQIDVYKTPEVQGGLKKYKLNKKLVKPVYPIGKNDKIVAAVGCGRILYIFHVN